MTCVANSNEKEHSSSRLRFLSVERETHGLTKRRRKKKKKKQEGI